MSEPFGTVTIAPDVLVSIARLTALATPGVACLSSAGVCGLGELFGGRDGGGVRVAVQDDSVTIDVRIVVAHGTNMLQLSQGLQARIVRAIQDMVGMHVAAVNVYIADVEFLSSEE